MRKIKKIKLVIKGMLDWMKHSDVISKNSYDLYCKFLKLDKNLGFPKKEWKE